MANYNIGYSTHVIGTSNNAASSLEIILYNKSDWPDISKISLYNMDQIYSSITNSEGNSSKYLRLTRENSEDPFIYNIDEENNTLDNGFTVILYISDIDNSPVGYTEFLSAQGVSGSLNIYTSFNSSVSDFIRLELSNSLSQLRNNSTVEKDFSDSETIYKYTSPEDIKNAIKFSPIYPRYTSHVYHVLENNYMNLKTDSGFINTEFGAGKISLNNGIDINPYNHAYTSYQIGFYGDDIVIYAWGGNLYSIQSLLQKTRFGNPIIYTTKDGLDYDIIEGLGTSRIILYFSGRFAVTMTTNYPSTLDLYDIERKIWIEPKYPNFYLDTLDPRSIIRSTPESVSLSNIAMYVPNIRSVFLDLENFSMFANICIVKKIGEWYVFRERISATQDFFTYSCIDKAVHTVKLKEEPIPINNSLLMIRTVDEDNSLDYYTIFYEGGHEYYTEKARAARNGSSPKLDQDLGILFYNGGDDETEIYRQYYKEGKIRVVHSKDGVFGNFFEGFRRGYYTDTLSEGIPNLVASIYGIIYYIDSNGNLYYL